MFYSLNNHSGINFFLFPSQIYPQHVAINEDGSLAHSSAALDIKSMDGGLLIPRTDTSNISSPAPGLLIFSPTAQCFFYYKSDKWVKLMEQSIMSYSYADRDEDGYGDKYSAIYAPNQLNGFVDNADDCQDAIPSINPSALELCDNIDNDCNPSTSDGSSDPLIGQPCDGADLDLCEEGVYASCTAGGLVCDDNTADIIDLCDGNDDDCNLATPDGYNDPQLGQPCDGSDMDFCENGVLICSNGSLICYEEDPTGNIEICANGVDDDCDGFTDEEDCSPG